MASPTAAAHRSRAERKVAQRRNAARPGSHAARKMLLALALFEAKRRLFRRLARAPAAPGARRHLRSRALCRDRRRAGAWPAGHRIAARRHRAALPGLCVARGIPCAQSGHPVAGSHRGVRPGVPRSDPALRASGAKRRSSPLARPRWNRSAAASPQAHRSPGPLRLVFMTQATSRQAAIPFWQEVAAIRRLQGRRAAGRLQDSSGRAASGRHLPRSRERAPDRFELLPADCNPIDAMLGADVVVSYNSMALVEALGSRRAGDLVVRRFHPGRICRLVRPGQHHHRHAARALATGAARGAARARGRRPQARAMAATGARAWQRFFRRRVHRSGEGPDQRSARMQGRARPQSTVH